MAISVAIVYMTILYMTALYIHIYIEIYICMYRYVQLQINHSTINIPVLVPEVGEEREGTYSKLLFELALE